MNDENKKILCIASVIGDTKDSKRVALLQRAGFYVSIAAFDRDHYVSRIPDCEISIIAKTENGKYLKRIWIMLMSIPKVRRQIKKHDLIYAFSPDLAFFGYLASTGLNKPLVMDVADIRELQVSKSIFGSIVNFLIRLISNKCELIVVTSEAFISDYFKNKLKANVKDYFLLENKVDFQTLVTKERNYSRKPTNKICVGYFGLLRDNWTVEFLLGLLNKYPNKFEAFLAGINMITKYDLKELKKNQKGFNYFGPFQSPSDLPELYSNVDIIALFYPEPLASKEWYQVKTICRSNRFYEACYFKKPLIAFSFSEDGKNIKNLSIGLTVDTYNLDQVIETFCKVVTPNAILHWVENLKGLPTEVYEFKTEPFEIKSRLNKILSRQ